jgi:hypothetical protein
LTAGTHTGLAALCGKPGGAGERVMARLERTQFVRVMADFMHGCAFDQVLTPIFRVITLLAAPSRCRVR